MAHDTIKAVLEALPAPEKALWKKERLNLSKKYIYYPDWYADGPSGIRRAIAPYARKIAGRDFHYFPVDQETFEGVGAWQTDITKKWRFATEGLKYYLSSIVNCLKTGEITRASCFMGWLCHTIQDQGAFFHSLEGPEGTHPFVFNIFFGSPKNRPDLRPTCFLHETTPRLNLKGYKPRLLGLTLAETGFHLFQRMMQVKRHNRRLLIPLIQAGYSGDKPNEARIRREIGCQVAEMVLDLFHTVFCLKENTFPEEEASALAKISVAGLCPLQYPNHLSPPYRFTPVVNGFSLNDTGRTVPLVLNEKGGAISYNNGFGTGCHQEYVLSYGIPKKVYRWFVVKTGLHAKLGKKGRVEIAIYLNRVEVFKGRFDGKRLAEDLRIDVRKGGILQLKAWTLTPEWSDPNNHIVWAEPFLTKN